MECNLYNPQTGMGWRGQRSRHYHEHATSSPFKKHLQCILQLFIRNILFSCSPIKRRNRCQNRYLLIIPCPWPRGIRGPRQMKALAGDPLKCMLAPGQQMRQLGPRWPMGCSWNPHRQIHLDDAGWRPGEPVGICRRQRPFGVWQTANVWKGGEEMVTYCNSSTAEYLRLLMILALIPVSKRLSRGRAPTSWHQMSIWNE